MIECEAIDDMCNLLGAGLKANETKELCMESEEKFSSFEAKVVNDFNRVEMLLPALEHEKQEGNVWWNFSSQLQIHMFPVTYT